MSAKTDQPGEQIMGRRWCFALGLVLAGFYGSAVAETWPTKQPIRAIVPFSPGSAADIIPRVILDQVSKQIGQTIVIENRVGAGGTIGTAAVARADADGYTLLITSSAYTITPSTYAKLPYDPTRSLSAVIPLANLPNVLVVAPAKFKSIEDLVATGKAKPGSLTYASGGIGATAHLNAERFRLSAGFEAVHVPFKGSPEALREVIAERIDFYFCPLSTALPLIREGRVRALAVSTANRALALPDVPTTLEAGYAKSDYNFWIGMFVTGGTSRDIIERLHQETLKAMELPAIKERLEMFGAELMPMSPSEFDAYVRDEISTNAVLVKAAGIKPN